jgi:drug/metabolite transporter (DMT)-like permease
MITYAEGTYVILGVIILVLHAIVFAASNLIIKTHLVGVPSFFLTHWRTVFILAFMLPFALATGRLQLQYSPDIYYVTLPSIFSAVLATLFIIKAYKLLSLSKVQLILAPQPFLVVLFSFLVFKETMTGLQAIGGIMVVAGLAGLIYYHSR